MPLIKKDGWFTNQHSIKPIKAYGTTKFGITSEFEEKTLNMSRQSF